MTGEIFPIQYDTSKKSVDSLVYKAVLAEGSQEYKIFHRNLEDIFQEIIRETGVDPRVEGPPDHIKEQTCHEYTESEL